MRRSTSFATTSVASDRGHGDGRTFPGGHAASLRVRSDARRRRAAAARRSPPSSVCHQATSGSPTRQQSRISSPSRSDGKSRSPLARSFTWTPAASSSATQRASAACSCWIVSASARAGRGPEPPPFPAAAWASACALLDRLAERCAALHHLLGERANGLERRVRLCRREEPPRHQGYHRAVVSVGQRVRDRPRAGPPKQHRPPVFRSPAVEIFLWSRAGDLGRGAPRAHAPRPEPQPALVPLGRAGADPRPRPRHRRVGALGQRLAAPHRRARVRRARPRHRVLPALPGRRGPARARARRPLRAGGHRRRRSPPGWSRSSSSTGSPSRGWARTARGAPCCTWRSSRCRSSSAPSTPSRSTCCSRSPRSCSPSGRASWRPAWSRGSRCSRGRPQRRSLPPLALIAWRAARWRGLRTARSRHVALRRLPAPALVAGGRPVRVRGRAAPLAAASRRSARWAACGTGCAPGSPERASSGSATTATSTGPR